MKSFETPWEFDLEKKVGKYVFHYKNVMEVSQGGPEIGLLMKNTQLVSEDKFGGPVLYDEKYIYAPLFVRGFFKSGFKLAKINIETLEIKLLGSVKPIIHLDKIENNRIYFFSDMEKQRCESISL